MELNAIYGKQIAMSVKVSKKTTIELNVLCEAVIEAIKKEITVKNYLPSEVGDKILSDSFDNLLEANRAVHKASMAFNAVLELVSTYIQPKANEYYTDIRTLRDTTTAEFMTNLDVVSQISAIAGRKANLEGLFYELFENYQKCKNYHQTIYQITIYLNEGLKTLSSLSRYLYSYDQMSQTQMYMDSNEEFGKQEVERNLTKRAISRRNKKSEAVVKKPTKRATKKLTKPRRKSVKWIRD